MPEPTVPEPCAAGQHEPAVHEAAVHEPAAHEPACNEAAVHEEAAQEPSAQLSSAAKADDWGPGGTGPDAPGTGVADSDERAPGPGAHPLPHLTADGSAHMVDVSAKPVTAREAVARGRVIVNAAVLDALRGTGVPKGDALAVARLAGIQAAKKTPDLVPLAHPVAIHAVSVDLQIADGQVDIEAVVRTADRTGIEMEALTCVAVAGLALIDMVKALDRGARISDIRVVAKSGGRSGEWRAE